MFRLTRTLVYGAQSNTFSIELTADGKPSTRRIGDIEVCGPPDLGWRGSALRFRAPQIRGRGFKPGPVLTPEWRPDDRGNRELSIAPTKLRQRVGPRSGGLLRLLSLRTLLLPLRRVLQRDLHTCRRAFPNCDRHAVSSGDSRQDGWLLSVKADCRIRKQIYREDSDADSCESTLPSLSGLPRAK